MFRKIGAGLLSALVCSVSQAAIEGVEFEDVYNQQKSLAVSDAQFINPKSSTTLVVSGGLDRKLRAKLLDGSQVIEQQTSDTISISDRISFKGTEFYGKKLTLAAPVDGNNYSYQVELLSLDGNLLDTWTHPVTVDTTPPVVGEFQYEPYDGVGAITGLPYVGQTDYIQTTLTGVTDANSGIDGGTAWSIDEFGNRSQSYSLKVSSSGETSIQREIFPEYLRQYTIYFEITDRAGNRSTKSQEVLNTQKIVHTEDKNKFEIVAIYDPTNPLAGTLPYGRSDLNDYAPYTPGMTISSNPIRVLARFKKDYHYKYDDLGIGRASYCSIGECISSTPLFEDANSVYGLNSEWRALNSSGSVYFDSANRGGYRDKATINVKLSPDAPIPPDISNYYLWREDLKQWVNGTHLYGIKEGNIPIEKVKATFKTRDYRQRLALQRVEPKPEDSRYGTTSKWHSVYAEPGTSEVIFDFPTTVTTRELWESSKEATYPFFRNTLTFYLHSDGLEQDLKAPEYKSITIESDQTPPVIESTDRRDGSIRVQTIETSNHPKGRTSLWDRWRVRSDRSTVKLTNSKGQQINLPLQEEIENTHYNRIFVYSLDDLPEGNYTTTTVRIEDNFGNSTTEVVNDPFWIDRTAPAITIFNAGQPINDGEMIVGLEAIEIELSDPNSPKITSVLLEGGPANDTVNLATRKIGENRYALEYPRIFPAMNPGEEYTLTVKSEDDSKNESTEQTTFLYQPIDLVDVAALNVLATQQKLLLPDDTPINAVWTPVLRTEEGHLAQGMQQLTVTLRSDAELPLIIGTTLLQPGETKTLGIEAETDGRLIIPITSVGSGQVGAADYMIEVPEISSSIQ